MGRVSAPYGILGWLKIQPYTRERGGLLDYPSWWLGDGTAWRECKVEQAAVHGKGLIAKLEGCDGGDAALKLKGSQIAVPREALPAAGNEEYYWADLIGLAVINTRRETLGKVKEILATGANDVLCVEGERLRLIPFMAAVILEVDLDAGVIRVDWEADY